MTPPKQFALTAEDKDSRLWHKLMAHWESRLDTLRTQNDGDKDATETAKQRGRIAECKANLALNNDLPDLEAPPR